MLPEQLHPRHFAPLHELFDFARNALVENPNMYGIKLKNHNQEYFAGLKERIARGKRSVRRFDKALKLLQEAVVDHNFEEVSKVSYPEANREVRQILHLLTWGYLRQNLDNKGLDINMIIESNKKQLSSLAQNLGRPVERITVAELAQAVMRGDFNPSFLSVATPLP